ncbi:MAG: OmpP1/FadL family transporter [Candidatus Saccharicenans sp.]
MNWKKLALVLLAFFLLGLPAYSNGLNLNGLGTKAVTMGGAFIGLADDFSLAYWNPAGAGYLSRPLLGTYITDLIPTNYYSLTMPPDLSIEAKTKLSHYLGFMLAYYQPLSKNLVVGLSVYTPSGLGANWKGDDFKLMTGNVAYDWTSKIGVFTISPLVAWKLSDRVSLGATFNLNYGMFSLKRWAGEAELAPDSSVDLGQYEESLHGWGAGVTLGLLVKPADWVSVGLTVKTPSVIHFKGTSSLFVLGYLGYPDSSPVKRNMKWPWFVGAGVALKPYQNLTLTSDVQWTGWTSISTIKSTFEDPVWQSLMAMSGSDEMTLDWKNRVQLRLGAEYRLSSRLFLRGGLYRDPSPAPDQTMNVLLPNFDFTGLTLGLGYEFHGLSVNWGMEYLAGKRREVTVEELMQAGTLGQAMPGTYRMHLLVPNLSVSYKF